MDALKSNTDYTYNLHGLVLVVMGENEQADDIEVDFQKNQSRNSCSGDIDKGSYGSIQESEPSYPDPNE